MQIAELKFGDVGRGLARYRPVALVVVAIVIMGLVLPGPERVAGNFFDVDAYDAGAAPVSAFGAPDESLDSSVGGEVAAAVEAFESSPGAFSNSFSAPSTFPSSSFDVDASATRPSESSSTTTFPSSQASTTTTSRPAPEPLRVASAGYMSAQAGTPLATAGVPIGSVPVGRRPGFEEDKVAFIRLTGNEDVLKLVPHQDASGQRSPEAAKINACRITGSNWSATEAQAEADAPSWDCTVAVQGRRAGDGSWTFDLGTFADRADQRGFALVPAGTGVDFQVAFTLA